MQDCLVGYVNNWYWR